MLTGSREFTAPDVEIAHSLEEALELCARTPQVWITGGAKVYREVMELGLADLLVVTQLDMTAMVPPMSTVAYAPVIDPVRWQLDLTRSDENWARNLGMPPGESGITYLARA
ncbi:Dihydrofolate reductase [Mobiluncus curtisii]|uniref:Dihydrofolate reductase n=1 Tax=Mobiluncus curtisii TaxID=2051 RepID=A0A2X3DW37_9ACTO|nr:Dihydrofolate reductase [Mobiluncus curtisii]